MADSKITALTALTAADPANDMIPIVDVSDTPPASGNTKRISINNLLACSPSATLASATITGDLTVSGNSAFTGTGYVALQRPLIPVGENGNTTLDYRWYSTGTTYVTGARVHSSSDAAWTVSSTPARLMFSTVPSGSTSLSERYRIDNTGVHTWQNVGGVAGTAMTLNSTGLGVGAVPSAYKLHVAGTGYFSSILTLGGASRISAEGSNALNLNTNSVDRLTIDSSGNVGIGVTPSAWGSNYKVAQVGQALGLNGRANLGYYGTKYNLYNDNTNDIAITTNFVGENRFELLTGSHVWLTKSTAGTAGVAQTLTQAMTLAANGQLLLGTTTTSGVVDTAMVMDKSSGSGFVGNVYRMGGADKGYSYLSSASASMIYETVTGYVIRMVSATNGVYLANGGTSWLTISDERNKDIIEPISNAVAKVGSLRSVIGKFKSEAEGTRRSFLIAQDVQAVLPEAVDSTNPNELAVSYTDVIPLLVAAIKELTARVQTLEAK